MVLTVGVPEFPASVSPPGHPNTEVTGVGEGVRRLGR